MKICKDKTEAENIADDMRDNYNVPWVVVMEYNAITKLAVKVYERHAKFVKV